MRRRSDNTREDLSQLTRLCIMRARATHSEEEVAQELGFVDETGAPLREAMYEYLEAKGLPDWVVYPGAGNQNAVKAQWRRGREQKRRARNFGRDKGELPPAEEAKNLFERDLGLLKGYVSLLQGLREHRLEEPERWLSYSWIEGDWESYDRRDFTEVQWKRLCEEHGVDPTEESFAFDLAPTGSPLGMEAAPWEGLVYLIAMHALMNDRLEPLFEALHPRPDEVDLADLHEKKGKDGATHNGVVTNLRAYAAQLAKVVRGGKGGSGRPVPGLSRAEMWVAWDLIHPLAQEGLSYKGIQRKLDEDGSLEVASKVLGYELTVADIRRLNNATRSPY